MYDSEKYRYTGVDVAQPDINESMDQCSKAKTPIYAYRVKMKLVVVIVNCIHASVPAGKRTASLIPVRLWYKVGHLCLEIHVYRHSSIRAEATLNHRICVPSGKNTGNPSHGWAISNCFAAAVRP